LALARREMRARRAACKRQRRHPSRSLAPAHRPALDFSAGSAILPHRGRDAADSSTRAPQGVISMSFTSEFKEFAMKGNVVDLAVGVIIGAAFGKIVDSIVKDLIMPVVGKLVGGLDFSSYFIMLSNAPADYKGPMTYDALTKAGVPLFAYGNFITVAINFIILAFIIFIMVKQINRLKKDAPSAPPAAPAEDVVLLREIRDALKSR
jgi:large conductance mechanosensitive channel